LHALLVSMLFVAAGAEVPLRMVRGRLPVVEVRLEDRGPFEFLLDTGSTATVVRSDLATSLGIGKGRVAAVGTPLGGRALPRGEVLSLSVGGLHYGPLPALVSNLEEVSRIDRGIQGILGLDWLGSFDFLIDYEKRRLAIYETGPGDVHPESVRYRLERGRILVPIGRKPVWLILDSGAEGLVLSEGSGLAIERSARELTRITTVAGSGLLRTGRLPRLRAGSVVLENVPVTILESSAAMLGGASGLLPGRFFRRLYVSPRRGYVVFEPD